jgi:hypothetical protein
MVANGLIQRTRFSCQRADLGLYQVASGGRR